jgi:hypothetical protein
VTRELTLVTRELTRELTLVTRELTLMRRIVRQIAGDPQFKRNGGEANKGKA